MFIFFGSAYERPYKLTTQYSIYARIKKIVIFYSDSETLLVEAGNTFVETSFMKQSGPDRQGTDAALEQVIKRSKKGVKIKVGKCYNCGYLNSNNNFSTWMAAVGIKNLGP